MTPEIRKRFETFLIHEKGLSDASIKAYLSHIRYLYRETEDPLKLTAYREVAHLIIELKKKRNWSDRMTYKMASMTCVFFNWAAREGLIPESPMRLGHQFKKVESKQVEFFDWDSGEFKKLMNHPGLSVRTRTILHVLRSSGIRNSELCSLKKSDVQDRWLRIREGKGGRERFAPVDQECRRWLDLYMNDLESYGMRGNQLFYTEDMKREIRPHILWKQLSNIGRRIGLKVYPHKFRHSLAGRLIEKGADITIAAEVLGHKSLSTTKQYTHLRKEKTAAIYDSVLAS